MSAFLLVSIFQDHFVDPLCEAEIVLLGISAKRRQRPGSKGKFNPFIRDIVLNTSVSVSAKAIIRLYCTPASTTYISMEPPVSGTASDDLLNIEHVT